MKHTEIPLILISFISIVPTKVRIIIIISFIVSIIITIIIISFIISITIIIITIIINNAPVVASDGALVGGLSDAARR